MLLKGEDESTRDQAFLAGFAHQAFRIQDLPEELASWMIDQSELNCLSLSSILTLPVCFERSDALDLKYLEILEVSCFRRTLCIIPLSDPRRMTTIFVSYWIETD